MMTADEDITSELDKVVCRLMKLTLRTSRNRQNPPPTKWMQCKLLDLLTLTEKAVERRRRHIIDNFPMRAITYGEDTLSEINKIKEDNTGSDLVKKYSHLVRQRPDLTEGEYFPLEVDDMTVYTNDKDFEVFDHSKMLPPTKTNLERTQAWVEEELELVKYPTQRKHANAASTDNSANYNEYNQYDRTNTQKKDNSKQQDSSGKLVEASNDRCKSKPSDGKYPKTVLCKKTSSQLKYNTKRNLKKREIKEHKILQSKISNPIPGSLIELCTPDMNTDKGTVKSTHQCSKIMKEQQELIVAQMTENGVNNEESYLGDIVMDGDGETALLHGVAHHTTGTDVETDKIQSKNVTILSSVINAYNESKQDDDKEKSQTIFIYDINEPSTSKGLRHVSMDAQCGPDDDSEYLAPTSSPLGLNGANIDNKSKHSLTNMFVDSKKSNFGLSMCGNEKCNSPVLSRTRSVGIKIKDSDTKIKTESHDSDTQIQTTEVEMEVSQPNETAVNQILQEKLSVSDNNVKPMSDIKVIDVQEITESKENNPDIANIILTRLKLCHAGLHFHSCKDKRAVEDVGYKNKQKSKSDATKPSQDEPVKRNSIKTALKNISNVSDQKTNQATKLDASPNLVRKLRPLPKNPLPKKTENLAETVLTDVEKNTPKEQIPIKKIQKRNPKLTIIKKRSLTRSNDNDMNKMATNNNQNNITNNIRQVPSKKVVRSILPKLAPVITINSMSNSKPDSNLHVKNYLPSYLRKRIRDNQKHCNYELNESLDTVKTKIETKSRIPRLKRAKTEDIKSLTDIPPTHLSNFFVYRNETRKSAKEEDSSDRSVSPVSVASSACSSPTSVITIKMHPCSNHSNKINDSGSKSATSIKSKRTLKSRSGKVGNKDEKDDKENDPSILCSGNTFIASNPTVFMTKVCATSTPLHTTENTPIKQRKSVIPDVENAVSQISVEDMKSNSKSVHSLSMKMENMEQNVLKLEQFDSDLRYDWEETMEYPRTSTPVQEIENQETNSNLLSDLLEFNIESPTENLNPIFMTELIDDMLRMIDSISAMPGNLDSSMGQEDVCFEEENTSIESANTVMIAFNNIMECDEHEGDESFDTVVGNDTTGNSTFTGTEVESLQTATSNVTNGDINDTNEIYPIAGSDNNDSAIGSVLDIFERKEVLTCPENVGPLAFQAFSGFSVNNPPTIGDQQPDYISLFDSETGSPAIGVSRHAESEEMFISGRSSLTYVSCSIDEDAAVPEWLFRIINQPLQVQDEDLDAVVVNLPVDSYDANGNLIDPLVGTDAGAGDGRGVHSDMSQDSSGQGSSLSSSDPSSGLQSEAVLVDPANLPSQFGIAAPIPLNFDSTGSSPLDIADVGETLDPPARRGRAVGPLLGTSDADADESSLDTDAD